MKKLLLVSLCFLMLCITQVFAQNRTVTGTVTAKEDGLPVPGVTVKLKGSTISTVTNAAGKYTLQNVPSGGVLVFSFIGYETLQATVTGPTVNAALTQATNSLSEVVVTTALGIKQPARSIGYSTTQVTSSQLTATDATNIANGLTAKVAGLGVYTLDNGVDPNVAIVLRGNRSLEGNNNALIVVDGIPIPGGTLASINPNDVESITILKGAGSAALYGSEASNGAVIITTKRGTGDGKPTIIYENSFQAEAVAFYPKLQSQFGLYGGEGGAYLDPLTGFTRFVPYENQQYGPAYDGSTVQLGAPLGSASGPVQMVKYQAQSVSPVKQFFNTGYTEQNSISFSQGDAKNSFFISAQNVYRTTVVPQDKNVKNAFSIRGRRTYGIFSADYSVGYTKTNISTYGGSYVTNAGFADLYASILQLPAFLDLSTIKDPNGAAGNPNDFYDAYAINPYWIINNSRRNISRDVLLSQLKLKVEPTKWFSASYSLSDNFGINQERDTNQEVDFSAYGISDFFGAGNVPSGFATTGKSPGTVTDFYQFGDGGGGYSRVQGDAVVDFHHTFFKDFRTSLIAGNTIRQQYIKNQTTGSTNLLVKDFYNINTIGGNVNASEAEYTIRNIAYFADLSIGYKNYLSLDATFRHEQDSRLSLAERSFNYPSVNVAFIPTDAISFMKGNHVLNYAKLRASYSQVGNIDIGPYQINNIYTLTPGFPYGSLGGLSASTTSYSPTLKPELTKEIELGTELSFLDSRIGVNFSYYRQRVKNQTVPIGTSITTGYSTSLLNIGETESKGEEIQVTGQVFAPVANKVGWTVGVNFSNNESKVISLLPNVNSLSLGNRQYAVVGQPFPLLEGTDFVRDPQGHVVVDANSGYPSRASGLTVFGRTTPQYNLGVTTALTYKFITLSAVAEYRGGDVVYNGIGSTLTFAGAGATTTSAGRENFIYPNSVIQTSPGVYVPNTSVSTQNGNYGFWQNSAFSGTDYPFVSSGAFWKLREVNLSFQLDRFVKGTKFLKGASFTLTGRNLFIWVPKTNPWTDPEFSNAGATSNLRGVNGDGQLPGTRIFGANIKLTF